MTRRDLDRIVCWSDVALVVVVVVVAVVLLVAEEAGGKDVARRGLNKLIS